MKNANYTGARLRLLALACLCAIAMPALAVQAVPPQTRGEASGMLDARVNLKASMQNAVAARPGAANAMRAALFAKSLRATAVATQKIAMPGLQVVYAPATGGISSILNNAGTLSAAAPGHTSESVVRAYLAQNRALFGLSANDLNDIAVLGDSAGGRSGLRMLRVEQRIDGRPVFQSETRFLLDRDGRLVKAVGLLVPQARAHAQSIAGTQLITPAAAAVRLAASFGHTLAESAISITADDGQGRLELTASDDVISGPMTARQVLFPLAPGVVVPAWSLVAFTSGTQDWYAIVDAQTGDLLWRKNIRNSASAHDARFRVYVQADGVTPADSPAPMSPTTAGPGVQPSEIAPTIVSMHIAMDPAASPNGWIDDCPGGGCTANETQTLGNNSLVCLDRVGGANDNICDTAAGSVLDGNGRPTGNPDANSRNRDFLGTTPRDFQTNFLPPPQAGDPEAGQTATGTGVAQDSFRRGSATHLFYLTNWYHDRLYNLGFDEASGNFQQTNFSGMGAGGDRVLADLEDNKDVDNANFSTPPDGTSGRMQMYRFTSPTIDRDAALDAEVVLHELTHGTSNRLVGNGAGLNWDPAGGMGEGWSDFYALSLLNNTNADDPNGKYASGAYATYKLGGSTDNYTYGIRRFPYSTDNSVNPLTWADVDDVTNNLSGGIPPSSLDFNDNGGMEVHNVGEIWANTLWGVRANVIADPAGANGNVPVGNYAMLQLVTDALKMTPIDPSFTDARDAILQADCATNACANEDSIWKGFANRGLGYGAYTPYNVMFGYRSSHMGVRESFTLPRLDVVDASTDVSIDDSATNNNGNVDPGETVRLLVALTNPWRNATKGVVGATATLTSTTPGVTIYTGTAAYAAIAAQGRVTGTPFMIGVDASVPCGATLSFTLTTVSTLGTTSTTFQIRTGGASGTDAAVTYTTAIPGGLAIPDGRGRATVSQNTVTDDFDIADIDFRVDNLTHTFTGDLTVGLRSPGGVGSDLISLIGGAIAGGGSGDNIVNMVIDDQVAFGAANDMVQAPNSAAPFTQSWLPVFNGPWPEALAFGAHDTVGTLSRFNHTSTKGTWSVMVSDWSTPDTGTLNSWSMIVTPTHFACAAVTSAAAVSATKTVSGSYQVGGTVTYTVTITNNGSGNQADNAGHEFTDTLPAGLTLGLASATSGTPATSGNQVTWDGSLAPLGGSVTITITATINSGTQGTTLSNQGTVSFDADGNGTNESTVSTDDPSVGGASDPTTFVVQSAGISATKTVSGTMAVGGTVTYTIVLSNSGASATTDNPGNELTDQLPSGLTLVSATATSGTASPNVGTNTVTWNGGIAAGGNATITIQATVNAGTAGTTISNQATIAYDADLNGTNESTGSSDDPSVGGANDPTSFVVAGGGGAVGTATMSVSGSFIVGGTVTYAVTLSNNGPSTLPDNPGNEFTDTLPAGLHLVSVSSSSGNPFGNPGSNLVTWNGSIPSHGSVTILITATINDGTSGTTISNQGLFAYDADLNGTNETTVLTDDAQVVGGANATLLDVRPFDVPAMSSPMLALMMLALALAAFGALRRRR